MSRRATMEAKSQGGAPGAADLRAPAVDPLPAATRAGASVPGAGTLEVRAPLSGVIIPLDAVPDPVFSRRMVGDGVAIDPTSAEVLAPVAGVVTQLHDAHHAIAITTDDGVEVLIHVGLDTVSLKGRGFTPLVARGARVAAGQPVLQFDPELLAHEARSLISVVLITGGTDGARLTIARGLVVAGQSLLLSAALGAVGRDPPAVESGAWVLSAKVALPNRSGLHARPAAVLATEAKKFASTVRLVRAADEVNAKSVVAVLGLSTKQGDEVQIKATGSDAAAAVAALLRLLEDGSGERAGDAPAAADEAPRPVQAIASGRGELGGMGASPGLAVGTVFQLRSAQLAVAERGGTPAEERARFSAAVREAGAQLHALKEQAQSQAQAHILGVHLALLDDPDLLELTEGALAAGKSAAWAWQEAFSRHAASLEKLDNPILRERAADLRDVGRRLLAALTGAHATTIALPESAIVIAREVTPSDLASFGRGLLGLCTTGGGTTSHVAILARAAGIPAICGIDEAALALPDGTRVIIDGTRGLVRVDPDAGALLEARERIARESTRREAERAGAHAEARTRDGHRVEVAANIKDLDEARAAIAAGAEGVGLLRTEFMFQDRADAPSEDEQAQAYRGIAEVLGKGRPLVIRTLDVGGDKPLPYLPLPKEENPFLGVRGLRVSLAHPELFCAQLRAIIRAAPVGDVHVMFPMVAGLEELRAARKLLAELPGANAVKVGVMIEVPSAALLAEQLAREVDFFSIGTNDLTQYTLAMDRGNAKLARQADALHPAVLRLIAMTVAGAHQHQRWVGVCGGLASDPLAAPVLVGLGVDELSVSVPAVATLKAALARWSLAECKQLAVKALELGTAAEVRALLAAGSD